MDIIKIDSPFNRDEFLTENMIRLKLVYTPLTRQTIGSTITTTLFLIISILLYFSEGKFNPFIIVTLIFAFITIFLLHILISSKNKFKTKIQDLAKKYEDLKLVGKYEISNEGIDYSDNEKTMNLKWTVFKHFVIYKEYLIISVGETVENSFFFSKHEMPADTFESLLSLVKSKLPQRTIK